MSPSSRQINFGAIAVLVVIAIVYFPIHHGGFFWVEKIWLRDLAWLRSGDEWKHFIFHTFGEWENYFRPLVTLLLIVEDRVFNVTPGPMHVVSLVVHLANTALIGALAWELSRNQSDSNGRKLLVLGAMLFYGMHPAMTEPVAWIACQFELVASFFMLLGLYFNVVVRNVYVRSILVATCFLLSACSKESAICFLPLVVLFDWMRGSYFSDRASVIKLLRSNWAIYAAIIISGGLYLALRWYSLGFLIAPQSQRSLLATQRLQLSAYSFLTYWRVILWPMVGQGPIHYFTKDISIVDVKTFATDIAAIAIVVGSAIFAWRRSMLGYIGVAVFLSLFSVLNIIPVAFDPSYYHDRYAGMAIAMVCVLVPSVPFHNIQRGFVKMGIGVVAGIWLILAIANIRVTLPLWGDELLTWQWVLRENPGAVVAKDHLLSTYVERGMYSDARPLADDLVANDASCGACLLNAANLALFDKDVPRASAALQKLESSRAVLGAPRLIQGYVRATAELYDLKGDYENAEGAFRASISMEPLDPEAQMGFARFLARRGRVDEARKASEAAISLFAPEEQKKRRDAFEQTLRSAPTPADG